MVSIRFPGTLAGKWQLSCSLVPPLSGNQGEPKLPARWCQPAVCWRLALTRAASAVAHAACWMDSEGGQKRVPGPDVSQCPGDICPSQDWPCYRSGAWSPPSDPRVTQNRMCSLGWSINPGCCGCVLVLNEKLLSTIFDYGDWVPTCGSVMTSYDLGHASFQEDLIPPCEAGRVRGLCWPANAKRHLNLHVGSGQTDESECFPLFIVWHYHKLGTLT